MTNSADGYIRHTVHGPVRQWAHRRRSQAQCLTGGVSRQTVSMDHSITHVHITTVGHIVVESSWNVTAHGDARVGKWRGNWWMEWVASTLHTTSEHGVSSITTADAHASTASSRLNWRPRRFKWTRPFRRKRKSGFCAWAITFELASTPRNARTNTEGSKTVNDVTI